MNIQINGQVKLQDPIQNSTEAHSSCKKQVLLDFDCQVSFFHYNHDRSVDKRNEMTL